MTENELERHEVGGACQADDTAHADGADMPGRAGDAHPPGVKICGITTMREADWVNAAGADYAGFVFYEKSRRSVSMMDAVMIKRSLYPSVKSVAVTVSPTVEQLRQIEIAGFDILQVHNELPLDVLRECRLPIWRAFNIASFADAAGTGEGCGGTGACAAKREAGAGQPGVCEAEDGAECGRTQRQTEDGAMRAERTRLEDALIEAYVLDGAAFGGGKPFDWADSALAGQLRALFGTKKLVLAGGLNAENVAEGIRLFSPDVVDVSSGVEREWGSGKDEQKIYEFVRKVREG